MEKLKLKIKSILMNSLNQKCTGDEIDALSEQLNYCYQEHKSIPLKNEYDEIVWVNIDDLLYIQKFKNKIEYHTISSVYVRHTNQIDVEDLLFNENFIMGDNKMIINKTHIKKYDSYMGFVYFEDGALEDSKKVTITQERMKMVKRIMDNKNDVTDKNNLIHTPYYKKPTLDF